MHIDTYQRESRTFANIGIGLMADKSPYGNLLACSGIAGEAGEVIDIVKKYARNPDANVLDLFHIHEEIGDLMWYIAQLCNQLEISLAEILEQNMAKLSERYSDVQWREDHPH